jgi:hypothetical protein
MGRARPANYVNSIGEETPLVQALRVTSKRNELRGMDNELRIE